MSKAFLLSLLFLTVYYCVPAQKIVGYLPYYRGVNPDFNYSLYTHIHYFTIWPGKNGEFIFPQGTDSLTMLNQFRTVSGKVKPKGVKMIITFGGPAESGSRNFIEMGANDISRKIFIENVHQLCNNWQADGIDIDWEWEQHSDTEPGNYAFTSLMNDLRKMADENGLLLSIDVSASDWNGKYYNPEAVLLADYINVMTYTYNGPWSGTANHHASMNDIINTGLPYWLNKGIPREKLNIGTAFFGQVYEGTWQKGGTFSKVYPVTYAKVSELIASGYSVVEDNFEGSFCYSIPNNEIVFFDSPQNVSFKMKYAIENHYSGIIIWEIGQDDNNQTLAKSAYNAKSSNTSALLISGQEEIHVQISGNLLVIDAGNQPANIQIFNLSGKEVLSKNQNGGTTSLTTGNLPAGIYIAKIKNDKQVFSSKFSIVR